jgi:hypothetical protein
MAGQARWWSTFPKDVQFASGPYTGPANIVHKTYKPQIGGDAAAIELRWS